MSDLLQFAEINSDFGCNIFAINVKLQVANVYIQWHNSSFYSHQFQISSRAAGARWVRCEFANSMVSIFGGIGSDSSASFTLWFDNCLLWENIWEVELRNICHNLLLMIIMTTLWHRREMIMIIIEQTVLLLN